MISARFYGRESATRDVRHRSSFAVAASFRGMVRAAPER
jgi:hypothetical protein